MSRNTTDSTDARHMRAALALARRGLGTVWPNPAVGCIVVVGGGPEGRVVGRGWTQPGGRPHAETEALQRAGTQAKGATAYVSLEPCCHHGKTPPCADALIEAGVRRVVVATRDPDPRVAGGGIARLQAAGINVVEGVCEAEAREVNAGFLQRISTGRPLITVKTATTLDGRIALASGESRWITGERARAAGHALRADHDAIMVGIGTALADDPELTCRLPGLAGRSPVRIVLDSRLRLPLTSRLVTTAREVPTWLITRGDVDGDRRAIYEECGVEVVTVPVDADGYLDLDHTLQRLGERGLTRVLVEGGAHLTAALARRGHIDRLIWFRAPRLLGGESLPAFAGLGLESLGDAPAFRRLDCVPVGDDVMETYARIV